MDTHRPEGSHALAGGNVVRHFAGRLLTSSLVLYLLAVAGQRAWVLLNSDVGQLSRRLH